MSQGHDPTGARRLARIALGGPQHDVHRVRWAADLWTDLRHSLRHLSKAPAFTALALLSIAISVGAASAVFAALKAVVLRPLPYSHPEQLVQIATDIRGVSRSHGDYVFWNDGVEIAHRTHTLASIGLWGNAVLDLAGDVATPPEALYGVRVSAAVLPTLGAAPMLGRAILPEDDQPGRAKTVLLSHGLWTRRFNSDPAAIGRRVKLNGEDYTVIGVMGPTFNFPLRREAARTPVPYVEFWTPLQADPSSPPPGAMGAIARLRDGTPLKQARADLDAISAALAREFPASNRDRVHRVAPLRDRTLRTAENALWMLMAAAGLFLLIGCGNVANLQLARGYSREREIAVRLALGAGRSRIIRQLLTESAGLSLAGGAAAFILAAAAWQVLPSLAPASIPRLTATRADWTLLAFSAAIAVFTGLLAGIAPALRSTRSALSGGALAIRSGAAGGTERLRTALVVSEIAIATLLAVAGVQLGGRPIQLVESGTGFDTDRIFAAVVLPSRERYPSPEDRALVYWRFLEAARAIPGVQKAGVVDALPFSGENTGGFVSANAAAPADERDRIVAEIDVTGGEYLQAMGVRLLDGRWFRDQEAGPSSDAALVDEGVAKRLWPGESAVGRRVCVFCEPGRPANWKQVVGVVTSIRHASLEGDVHWTVYLAGGAFERAAFLVLGGGRPPAELDTAVRKAVASVDPNQPVLLGASMRSLVSDSIADRRFVAVLLGATVCLALLLAVAGVYGVVAYLTSRRTHEIGIRVALGATRGRVQGLVLGQGLRRVLAGVLAGLAAAVILLRALRGQIAGFETLNPEWMAAAALVVAAAAVIACWIPARRAASIDPLAALRQD